MAKPKTYKKPSKDKRRTKERDKIRAAYQDNLPEGELNPDHKEDFESLLAKMVNTPVEQDKPKRKRSKPSRRDQSVKVEKGLLPKRKKAE